MPHEPAAATEKLSGLAERLKRDGRASVESGKRTLAERIGEIALAIDRARAHLEQSEPALAGYAGRIASKVGNFSTRLKDRSLDDVLEESRGLARRNPALFVAGAMALGFALSRFVKSSARHESRASTRFASGRHRGSFDTTQDLDTQPGAGTASGARGRSTSSRPAGG